MQTLITEFGPPSRRQVGVLQRAGTASPRAAWLLARPMGQEAVRTAATYRVLSDRVSRAGCEALRFDYHGTGDAAGEEADQSLDGWVQDLLAAQTELHRHVPLLNHGGLPEHWFGMGLGANLLLQAAMRSPRRPRHIVIWEPVCHAAAYIQSMQDTHRGELQRELGMPWETLLRRGLAEEPRLPGKVLGFDIGVQLANDLNHLTPAIDWLPSVLRTGTQVTAWVHAEDRPALQALGLPGLHLHTVTDRTNWMSSQAMGTAIVPPELPKALTSTLP